MFTAALFTIAKTWKQLKCPSTDGQIKKAVEYTHTHTQQNTTAIRKEQNFAIYSNMNGVEGHHAK